MLLSHMPRTDRHQAQPRKLRESSLASESMFSHPQLLKLHVLCATSMQTQVAARLSLPKP